MSDMSTFKWIADTAGCIYVFHEIQQMQIDIFNSLFLRTPYLL